MFEIYFIHLILSLSSDGNEKVQTRETGSQPKQKYEKAVAAFKRASEARTSQQKVDSKTE